MNEREIPVVDWSIHTTRANGIEIEYRRSGGDKPPLVALHGLIGSGTCLVPLARFLTDHFDVILPDARGHGGSDAPEQGYSYIDLAADVRGLLDNLMLHTPVLLGHSMGGMTAALIASKLERNFTAVILIDPTFISPEWQRDVYESDVATEHQQLLSVAKDELLMQARLRNPNRSTEIIGYLIDARLQTSLNAFAILTPPNPDWQDLIRALTVPSLLVTGDRGLVSPETAQTLQNFNSLLCHAHLADAGHGMPYDVPERLGATLLAFLAQKTVIEAQPGPAL